MVSYIFSGLIFYAILIGGLWFGASLGGTLGSILVWLFFALSSFMVLRIYSFIREFLIIHLGRCNEIDQDYIDEQMRLYEESKNENA